MSTGSITQLVHRHSGKKAWLVVMTYPERLDGERVKRAPTPGITIPVQIKDVRIAYGHEQVLVEPIGGKGTVWVGLNDKLEVWDEQAQKTAEPASLGAG